MGTFRGLAIVSAMAMAISANSWASDYDPSTEHPFGRPNPAAPVELAQFAFAVGEWTCDVANANAEGGWDRSTTNWTFRYTLNGMAIEDQVDGRTRYHDIRQFDVSSGTWKHTFLGMNGQFERYLFEGTFTDGEMVLENEPATNAAGQIAHMRFTFHGMADDSFEWRGESITDGTPFVFSTMVCNR